MVWRKILSITYKFRNGQVEIENFFTFTFVLKKYSGVKMTTVITIIHVLVALSLILVVLLQGGKGADMGAAFGGASQTIFGSSGAATFLGRLTAAAAIIFMITSLSLTVIGSSKVGSVMPESAKPKAAMPQEAKPALPQETPAK